MNIILDEGQQGLVVKETDEGKVHCEKVNAEKLTEIKHCPSDYNFEVGV